MKNLHLYIKKNVIKYSKASIILFFLDIKKMIW